MSKFLKQIIEAKQQTLKKEKTMRSKFLEVFKGDKLAIIGEVKFASPSAGDLGTPANLMKRVKQYEKANVDAISIITEQQYFKGDKEFIVKVKKITKLPILQKDFVIDPYQIYESKLIGADALLLIARLVNKKKLNDFVKITKDIGIEPVVEVFSTEDLEKAIATETNIIAVNARDLDDFSINIESACQILKKIPSHYIKLGFSGIKTTNDIKKYQEANVNGVLIGTSLMQAGNINDFLKTIL